MPHWDIHYLNACGQLEGLIDSIEKSIQQARSKAESLTDPIDLDIVVQVWPGRVIEQMGFTGYAPTGTMMQLTFDPENKNLKPNLGEPVERLVAHELHHVLRWRRPGYGRTLGEALVSEGLAGHFCRELYNSEPELWEVAVSSQQLNNYIEMVDTKWSATDYNHFEWFLGWGNLPRWLGYSMGYALVGAALKSFAGETASSLVDEPADCFRRFLKEL